MIGFRTGMGLRGVGLYSALLLFTNWGSWKEGEFFKFLLGPG